MRFQSCCVSLALLCAFTTAQADILNIPAAKDNTIYQHPTDALSNGAGEYFFAGNSNQSEGERIRRALLMFDVAGALPAGSIINSVTLSLYASRTGDNDSLTSLHRLDSDWGEGASIAGGNGGAGGPAATGDATWEYAFFPSTMWSSDGGDFQAVISASTLVTNNGFYLWGSTSQMVADVQLWLDSPGANVGWLIMGDESNVKTAKRFQSRENTGNASRLPQLTVDFTPPAGLGACCFPDGSCQELTEGDCEAQGGIHQEEGTDCATTNCPQPTGACCFGDDSCQELTSADCATAGGFYFGDFTDCTPNPCTTPTGACCFADGSCAILIMDDCITQGGTYQGDDTLCTPNPCPQPLGACCFSGASCSDLTALDCVTMGGIYEGDFTECATTQCPLNLEPFVDALPVPGPFTPTTGTPGGAATYDIAITQFNQQLHRDLAPTTCWGYGGTYPAATIEAWSGTPITVNWINNLRDEFDALRTDHYLDVDLCPHGAANDAQIVTHLHGGHVPPSVDGYPEHAYPPGSSETYVYPNNQPPATLWYHDHALGITRLNVYMGMAGFYIVRDQFELDLGLPSGEFEVPMAFQDRTFNLDGSFMYPSVWQDRFFGDTILVNGKVWPFLNVKQGKYRFRMLGGANSRVFRVALSNGATFQVIGNDGGLLPAPVTMSQLTVHGGERYDVIMDFEPYPAGTEIILTNDAPAPFPGDPGVGVIPNVMKFIVTADPGHTAAIPAALRPVEPLLEADAVMTRTFEMEKVADPNPCSANVWKINGLGWDDITEYPELGDTEIWSFINKSGVAHPMHMHLVFFQLLDRQPFELIGGVVTPTGVPTPAGVHETGWKDTVEVPPFEIVRVIARFEDYAGKYAYHCHILEHEDHEMMRQFVATQPCASDGNRDGQVGVEDFLNVLSDWGACPEPCSTLAEIQEPDTCPSDHDRDCVVGIADFLEVLAAWGPCP